MSPDAYGFPIKASERQAQAALKAERRKPTDADRLPLSRFPGPKVKPLPSQLDLFGHSSHSPPLPEPR